MVPNGGGAFILEGLDPVKVTGVPVIYADRPGRNRNVYPKVTLREGIDYYERLCGLDGTYKYAFAKHPKDENEEWLGLIAGTVDRLYFDDSGNTVMGDFTLLPTIWGHLINWLIKNNYPVGTSVRGSAQGKKGRIEFGGKTMDITNRSNLKLEGVDFVIYPSFVTTHANKGKIQEQYQEGNNEPQEVSEKYERILESFCSDTATETGLDVAVIKKLMKQECTTDREGHNMDELDLKRQKAQLDVERAEIAMSRLESEKAELEKAIENLRQERETLSASVQETHALLQSHNRVNDTLKADITKAEQEHARVTKECQEQSEKAQAELEKVLAEMNSQKEVFEAAQAAHQKILEAVEEKGKGLSARFAGKTFNEENRPKIKIVPVDEKIFDGEWDSINKDVIKKLVTLSGSREIAENVFGVVDAESKKKLEMCEHGIPAIFCKKCKKTKKEGEEKSATDVVENVASEKVTESTLSCPVYYPMKSEDEGYDVEMVLSMNGLASAASYFQGKEGQVLSPTDRTHLSNFIREKYEQLQNAGYGEIPKSFKDVSERQQIAEKVITKLDDTLADAIHHAIITGSIVIPSDKITENTGYDEERIKNALVSALIGPAIEVPATNEETSTEKAEGEEAAATTTEEAATTTEASETSEAVQEMTSTSSMDRTVGGTTDAGTEEGVDTSSDTTTGEEETSTEETGEEEMGDGSIIQKLREMLESRLEGVTIQDDNQVMDIVMTLIDDYSKIYNDLESLTLTNARQSKMTEMRGTGVDESVLKDELDKAETIEDIEACADRLMKLTKSIKESSTRDTRRSVPIVPSAAGKEEQNEEKPVSSKLADFEKLMKNV